MKNISEINLNTNNKYYLAINKFINSENNYFNEIKYHKIQSRSDKDLYFQLVRKTDDKAVAAFSFIYDDNSFYSPLKGTFGGPYISKKDLNFDILEEFIFKIIDILSQKKPAGIHIKLSPMSNNMSINSIFINLLLRKSFKIKGHEINYHIEIRGKDFIDKINYAEKKRLKKCIKNNYIFKHLDFNNIEEVYKIIKDNRDSKKYSLSMSQDELINIMNIFPDKFKIFGVYEENNLIASSVCLEVERSVLYVFYWADNINYSSASPVTFLASGIYKYCQDNNYSILDIGTATIDSEPNYGLISFKKNLGFKESIKFTLSLEK